jgi:hypothetical protein
MLQVYRPDEGDDEGAGVFVEAAFCRDKPAWVLCKVQGAVHGFDFSFDKWEISIGGDIVD